jgi:uncharacterized protein (DUF433 family)
MDYRDRILIDPEIRFAKPCVRGTRISVGVSAAQRLYRAPPKVIWIRLGNCSTADIIGLLRERHNEIERFVVDEEAAFLALA